CRARDRLVLHSRRGLPWANSIGMLRAMDAAAGVGAGQGTGTVAVTHAPPPGPPLRRHIISRPPRPRGLGGVHPPPHPPPYPPPAPGLARPVALKVLRGDLAAVDDEARARLLREARAVARLAHPNVVAIHDVGAFGDGLFIAMELIDGEPLSRWLGHRRTPA